MNTKIIKVPKGIRYLSDWTDFDLENYPYILDKQIPGCGFTEWCIRNKNKHIVVCSPRKILLENKYKQHPGETHLVINQMEKDLNVDKDLEKIKPPYRDKINEEELKEKNRLAAIDIKNKLDKYIGKCQLTDRTIKILVTYDSFRHVKSILRNADLLNDTYIVVDEFQSIFTDSSFKSTTELEFVNQLQDLQKVCYASATPMIKEYLEELDEFKDLPYHKLDWGALDGFRLKRPNLKIRTYKSLNNLAKSIIDTYLDEKFESASIFNSDGTIQKVESKEAVFYVNSVKNILGIIKKCELKPDQVNILCSKTDQNEARVKRLGKGFCIGEVPLEDEPRKMFTFCTRTVYLGADFYSDNARSFIISDANLKTLKVDINLDLPQILGRQRLDENPWKNRAEFYFKSVNNYKKKTLQDFKKEINRKERKTENLLSAYDTAKNLDVKSDLVENFKIVAETLNYSNDYVAVNEHAGKFPIPVKNELVKFSEIRAFEIQQLDYADRFTVISKVDKTLCPEFNMEKFNKFFEKYKTLTRIETKLKLIVETNFNNYELNYLLDQIDIEVANYLVEIGVNKIKSCGYNITDMKTESDKATFNFEIIKNSIYSEFIEGSKVSLSKIKEKLSDIYNSIGYKATPKAKDLEEWFELKTCKFIEVQTDGTKKSVHGYNLIKKLK